MNLEKIYDKISNMIKTIDFSVIWPGFKPLKFALYTDDLCFFNGEYIEKTDEFLANTSILYNDEYIAIWNIQEELSIEVLTSKIIHEMFHGFQMMNNESRFPNELEALEKYQYIDDNLSLKYLESKLIIELINNFDINLFNKLLSIRKYRYSKYNYEFEYEAKIEQIEGSANFIELSALKQLSNALFNCKLQEIKDNLLDKSYYLPIRIISYDIGALLLFVLRNNNLPMYLTFSNIPFSIYLLNDVLLQKQNVELCFSSIINTYYLDAEKIINKAIENNNIILEGKYELCGVNIYNAIYKKPYLISEYFVMYKDNIINKILYGNFVIEIEDKIINRIFQF